MLFSIIVASVFAASPEIHRVELSLDEFQRAVAGEYDTLLEAAAASSPVDARGVELVVRGTDGELEPVGSLLPHPLTVPQKSEPAGPPVDHPGRAEGFLSGRAVYVSQCHGWYYNEGYLSFLLQRGNAYDTVEDLHNPEATNQILVNYLENAGARVFTAKERDHNPLMAISDNDGDGYSENGPGFETGELGFLDQGSWVYGENPFDAGTTRRFPATDGGVASWTPEVPADGRYAVYVSWDSDSANSSEAHYRITHPGGVIHRYYDQRVHGSTWQYVESLWLPGGVGGLVVELVADGTDTGAWLSADAVRVGGGMEDVTRGGITTNRPRWESGAIYYTQFNGAPNSVYDPYYDADGSDPTARSKWAAWEHPTGEDAVYVSWHSNASAEGTARGTSTYTYDGWAGTAVSGSYALGDSIQSNLIDAIQALWEPGWTDRGHREADFAEINPSYNPETPSALIELAFHDESTDAAYLKDPEFRADSSRAIYRGIADYFAERDGVDATYLPEPPESVALVHDEAGRLQLSFTPGPAGFPFGDEASGFVVYTSADGRAWDNGFDAVSSPVTLDTGVEETVFVRVAASNAGGISFPSEVVGARRSGGTQAGVLVVAAFDRLETSLLPWEEVGGAWGSVRRMELPRVNPYDIVAAHGRAIDAMGWSFDSISDERLTEMELSNYDVIVWAAGEESTWDETFSASQQTQIKTYLQLGGALLASGAEILWDLDSQGSDGDRAFANDVLGVGFGADDAGTSAVSGVGALADLDLGFAEADGGAYPVEYPDVLTSEADVIAQYEGGAVAAVLGESVALFGFPLETIASEASRLEVFSRVLPLLAPDHEEPVDTGYQDTGAPTEDTGVESDKPRACGCSSATGTRSAGGWVLVLGLLLGVRRGRRGTDRLLLSLEERV